MLIATIFHEHMNHHSVGAVARFLDGVLSFGDIPRAIESALRACGDMAGDPMLLWVLLGLGLRELSMAPRQLSFVRYLVRQTRLSDAEQLVQSILGLPLESEVEALVYRTMHERFPGDLT